MIDTSDRTKWIDTKASFIVSDTQLRDAVKKIKGKYATKSYKLGICDCVSFTADLARESGLKTPPPPNFLPEKLVENLRKLNP